MSNSNKNLTKKNSKSTTSGKKGSSSSSDKEASLIGKILHHIFVDGMNGMALGLFATLLIGTILEQIGKFIPGETVGPTLVLLATVAKKMMGFGIGVGVAANFKRTQLGIVSSGVAGLIGAFSAAILAGSIMDGSKLVLAGVGEPVGAFIAALVAAEIAGLVAGKTKLDILLVPSTSILSGGIVGLLVGPGVSWLMALIGGWISWGTDQAPFVAGIVVSTLTGMALTLPISSAAICVSLGMSGYAAGAATVGCCANMVGFAMASFRENGFSGLLSQGIGTSMLQMSNIVRKPIIWVPAILTSAILGPISTCVFKLTSQYVGAGMGTCGMVGPWIMFQDMTQPGSGNNSVVVAIEIVLMCVILPGLLSLGISEFMRKMKWIKDGDMKLEV